MQQHLLVSDAARLYFLNENAEFSSCLASQTDHTKAQTARFRFEEFDRFHVAPPCGIAKGRGEIRDSCFRRWAVRVVWVIAGCAGSRYTSRFF